MRKLFAEAATGVPASKLCVNANALGLAGKDGKRGHWDARALLRLLQNPVYAGRRLDGSPGVHAPIIDDESFDKVQAIIASRRTRSPSKRTTVDPRIDPFILRGLLACEACGKTMTTSMSTALTKTSAVRAPRYYRCRTPGCAGGQVAATEVEDMAHRALRRPRPTWPAEVRERMELLGSVWSDLWLGNRRRALASVFESMRWRARTRRLLLRLVLTVEVQAEADGVVDGSRG